MLAFRHMKRRTDRKQSLPVDIASWSKMGLFLDEARRVCCFCCGYCTAAWSPGDDPWKFHQSCDFASFNAGRPLPDPADGFAEGDPTCIVCFERKIAAAFSPCRHAVCCMVCSLRCSLCPTCRSKVSERFWIILP